MKKILFLVTQSEFGGAQRYVYEISRMLSEKYEILVAAGDSAFAKASAGRGELFQKLENTGVQPRYLKQMRRTPWPWQVILAVKEIVDLLKKERPDVLFLCSTTAGLLGSMARIFYKVKIIYRIGGWAFRDPRAGWKNAIIFWLEKITAPLKDLIVVNSEYDWRIAIEKRIVSPEKIVKIYNGIDVDSLDFLPKDEAKTGLSAPGAAKLIGCVANFYKTKGLDYLVEAFDSLMSDPAMAGSDIKLFVIGEGRERPKLEALIKKYRLENKIVLAGRIPDAYKYLKAFDAFVLPSLKEGFPWIILEAMAAELPIVATNVGALPEIIENEEEGFLVRPGSAGQLAEKINWLLEHAQEAKVIGIQARLKVAKEFSLQKMVEETEKLFS